MASARPSCRANQVQRNWAERAKAANAMSRPAVWHHGDATELRQVLRDALEHGASS